MSTPEGWYADPQRPGVPGAERWWNGASWTAHTRDRPPPAADPPPVVGVPVPGLPGRQPTTTWPQLLASVDAGAFGLWDQLTKSPVPRDRTTSDGEPLAPLLARFLAWLFDLVLVAVLVGVVGVLSGVAQFLADLGDGSAAWSSGGPVWWPGVLATWVAAVGYQALFLRHRGATPGMDVLNLAVRQVGSREQLPWSVVLRRAVVSTTGRAADVLALVPVVGALAFALRLFVYVDGAAVVATRKQQALHDLVAGTQVVQRPRGWRRSR